MKKVVAKSLLALGVGLVLAIHVNLLWSQEAAPDPTGGKTGSRSILGDPPEKMPPIELPETDADPRDKLANDMVKEVEKLGNEVGKNRAGINMMWTLLTGFLVMFM